MKINIQGADEEALFSARKYRKNFICVVAELQDDNYDTPEEEKRLKEKVKQYLIKNGFKKVYHGEGLGSNQAWINLKYMHEYLKT